ncbi:MAG: tRNA adenosine(34) deaminase TadA [Proteobacteria bacterium]|nr:tRNA adenosine(34) deaminase TadA [Pseudomonadota bacterium]NOG60305.1 tRNA adenosine(34) deaminase TadA [Pseudomonadota bacterium]
MSYHEKWMQRAFKLAEKAKSQDEVPVGAVIVLEDKIIGEGWNQPISANDPAAHAEIIALRNAGNNIGNYRLPDATMYVTLEPCAMCAGAIVHARLAKLIYATDDPKTGACGSIFNLLQTEELNHKVEIEKGILEEECRTLIQDFFKVKRIKK